MTTILLLAMLVGPPLDSHATLTIRVHVGSGRESDIVRAELAELHPWFSSKRMFIETTHRIMVVEDLYRARPCYQIGKGDDSHSFAPGSFSASGSFTRALASITSIDQWDREHPLLVGWTWAEEEEFPEWMRPGIEEHFATRPIAFPPGSGIMPLVVKYRAAMPIEGIP